MIKLILPKFWLDKNLISLSLTPFSFIYFIIFLSKKLFSTRYSSKAKIICVGNASVGGAGKTPSTLALGRKLIEHKKKVVFISKGYRGKLTGPILVNKQHTFEDVGDEPLILAKHAPTIVAKNRKKGLMYAEKLGFDFIVCDDGFQDYNIQYNLKILIFDSSNNGNGLLLPAGPLRQTVKMACKEADIILSQKSLPTCLNNFNHKNYHFTIMTEKKITDKKYILFAGIANPNKFFYYATLQNINTIKNIPFPNHHHYTTQDLQQLIELQKSNNATLMTTEKDFVKIPLEIRQFFNYMPITYDIKNIKSIIAKII